LPCGKKGEAMIEWKETRTGKQWDCYIEHVKVILLKFADEWAMEWVGGQRHILPGPKDMSLNEAQAGALLLAAKQMSKRASFLLSVVDIIIDEAM